MKENSNSNTNISKKKNKVKIKTYLCRVVYHRNNKNTPIPLFLFEILIAVLLDTLTIIKNLIVSLFVVMIAVAAIAGVLIWQKIEPIYNEYNTFAEEVVNNATYDSFKLQESSYIYDVDGKLICKLKADQDSSYISYNEIPSAFIDAFVAVEDRSFWDNSGIDFKGIARILYNFVKTGGEEVHGASTITQQLARNIFLTHEVSLERKGKEMLIAMKLTSKFTKEEIMEFYCNDICFANTYYGISAAAKGYFNKNVNELTLSEICYLCAIPNSPEYYNPYKYPERALERRDKILGDMMELGLISRVEYNRAINEEIVIEKPSFEFNNYMTTYAIDCAVQYIMKENEFEFKYKYTDEADYNNYKKEYAEAYENAKYELVTGGYKVYTSLDPEIQNNIQLILDEKLAFDEEINEETGIYELQGAVTCIDNSNGKVVAVVGGRSQDTDGVYSLNRAFQSYRQPGSSIKPLIVYAPAIISGYTPNSMVQNIDVATAKEKGVNVQELTGPEMTLRRALEQSKNGVAWQLFDKITPQVALSYITEMQFSNICPDDYYNSAALGGLTYGVTTAEMASAFSTLVNHGYYRDPSCIIKMIDRNGDDIYREENSRQIYNEVAADTTIDMMTGVLIRGTASKLGWYNSTKTVAACKTGTTNNSKDGWLCGSTPYYSIAVWVGYDTPKTLNNLWGSTYPAQIWKDSMLSVISDLEVIEEFEKTLAYDSYVENMSEIEEIEENTEQTIVYSEEQDSILGEQLQQVIDAMYTKDKTLDSFPVLMQKLRNDGQNIINKVGNPDYKNTLQSKLDWTYNALLREAGY